MDLNYLANFGILGLWTMYLIYEKKIIMNQFNKNVIENTAATKSLSVRVKDNTMAINTLKAKLKTE